MKTTARKRSSAAAIALALLWGACALGPASARAGTIYLLNGEELDGEVVGVTAEEVTLRHPYGTQRISLREIRDVEIGAGGGDSIWKKQVQDALANSRKRASEESARKIKDRLRDTPGLVLPDRPAIAPPPTTPPPTAPVPDPVTPQLDPTRSTPPALPTVAELPQHLLGAKLESSRFGFLVHFPTSWAGLQEDAGFFTFRDPHDAARATWSFNVTALDASEADYAAVVDGAGKALDATAGCTVKSRARPIRLGHVDGQRSICQVARGGKPVRLDQVILNTRNGVLVFDFFTPGGSLDDSGAGDVDVVLDQIEWK